MSDIREAGYGRATADTTIVTTTEVVTVTSEPVKVPRATMRALIVAYINVDSGAGTTAVTPRIRSGSAITGTVRSEEIAQETTAAEAHEWVVTAEEILGNVDEVVYSATVQQTGASGNGTVNNATILVFLF